MGIRSLAAELLPSALQGWGPGENREAMSLREMVELFTRVPPTASQLSAAVARTLGDPRASVLYRRHDASGYVDERGRPVAAPGPPGARRTRG